MSNIGTLAGLHTDVSLQVALEILEDLECDAIGVVKAHSSAAARSHRVDDVIPVTVTASNCQNRRIQHMQLEDCSRTYNCQSTYENAVYRQESSSLRPSSVATSVSRISQVRRSREETSVSTFRAEQHAETFVTLFVSAK